MLLEGNEERGIFTDMKGPTKLKLKLKAQIKSQNNEAEIIFCNREII